MTTADVQQSGDGAPPVAATPDGIFCLVHGQMDCSEPWCWRCGNHEMDDFGRCADPRCRSTCTPEAMAAVERVRAAWPGPVPVEVLSYSVARHLLGARGDGSADVAGGSLPSAEPKP